MTVDEWAEAFARWQASELAVEAVVTQAVDEPELPEAPHRRDATALAVERLFRLHGFPVAEWAAPLLEAENPLNPPACPAPVCSPPTDAGIGSRRWELGTQPRGPKGVPMADATQKESRRAIAQVAANTRWSRYYQRKAAEAEARLAEALEELGAHAEDES